MQKKTFVMLLILPFIWGGYYLASNAAVSRLSVFPVGVMIRLVTMVFMTAVMLFRGELKELKRIQSVWPRLILIGTLGFLLDATAFLGLSLCPAGIGTVLLKSDILFVTLISVIFYHYHFSRTDWICTFIMLGGVVLVLDIDFSHVQVGGFGNLFFILSALFVSINAFVIQSVLHDKVNPLRDDVVAWYNNLITLIYFLIFSTVSGSIRELVHLRTDTYADLALLLAALGQTLIYIVYYYNLRENPVWLVKVFLLLMPVVSTVLSYLIFGEVPKPVQLAGMAAVLCGAAVIIMEQRRKPQTTS